MCTWYEQSKNITIMPALVTGANTVLLFTAVCANTINDPGRAAPFFSAPSGAEPEVSSEVSMGSLTRGVLRQYDHRGVKFGLFLPARWRRGASHPVIVFLHGRGESGGFAVTNAQSLPWLLAGNNVSFASTFQFIVVAPQCPRECMMENGWSSSVLRATAELVNEWLVPELGGDPHRVYVAGQSMGGHGAWAFASQQPRLFAAVVVVCGYAQGGEQEAEIARRLVRSGISVGVYHSADDSVIPVDASDRMVGALRAARTANERGEGRLALRYVRYEHAPGPPITEFENLIGHGSYELAFRDETLYQWLLQQECRRCGRPLPQFHELPPPLLFG